MKKKILLLGSLLLTAGLILWLSVKILQPKETDRNVVGICYRDGLNAENTVWRTALENDLQSRGFSVEVFVAAGDQAVQNTQLQELKKRGCDVALVEPVLADAAEEICQSLSANQIPGVLIHKESAATLVGEYENICYIGYEETGAVSGHLGIISQLPNGGDVNGDGSVACLVLGGPEQYYDGKTYGDYLETVIPDSVYIVSAQACENTVSSGKEYCKQALASYGKDIEVILCSRDLIAVGAHQAVADGGRTVGKDVYLLGIGDGEEAMSLLSQGNLTATMVIDQAAYRSTICDTLEKLLNRQPAEPVQRLPYHSKTEA